MNPTKSRVAVFTAWPELVKDKKNLCDLVFLESVDSLLISTFGTTDIPQGLQRFVVRLHDRNLCPEFDHCLFVNHPVEIEISNFWQSIDLEHTTYLDQDNQFIFYKRNKTWTEKYLEIFPNPVGIIFIDCWQTLHEHSLWPCNSKGFDFFKNIKEILAKYQPKNLVFHTGTFGGFPLATELKAWQQQGNAIDIVGDHLESNWPLQYFEQHYQNRNLYNWIVVGAHWQRCTHDKPLGFYNLLDLKKIDPRMRIFSHMDCTVKFLNNDLERPELSTLTARDYEQDGLIWRPNNKLPELIGPI